MPPDITAVDIWQTLRWWRVCRFNKSHTATNIQSWRTELCISNQNQQPFLFSLLQELGWLWALRRIHWQYQRPWAAASVYCSASCAGELLATRRTGRPSVRRTYSTSTNTCCDCQRPGLESHHRIAANGSVLGAINRTLSSLLVPSVLTPRTLTSTGRPNYAGALGTTIDVNTVTAFTHQSLLSTLPKGV